MSVCEREIIVLCELTSKLKEILFGIQSLVAATIFSVHIG